MKVASTVLRRGLRREMGFLSDDNNQTEKDEILNALKNSSIIHWNHINFYGEYDITRSYKRIHRLIALEETKGFLDNNVLD